MVANSLIGIIAQRLVRRLCKNCRKPHKMTPLLAAQLGLDEAYKKRVWRAGGCEECLGSGYLGRTGVFEVIRINEELRPKITTHRYAELEQAVREQRMVSLAEAGVQKVLDGTTSVEEVTRKVMLDI
jgi:type II secretory ATPase GspE/PulE/Tfp pilus assembly ATPase PilB-like protein